MKRHISIKIIKLMFIAVWTVCTITLVKINLEYASDVEFFQQRSKELYNEKNYWEKRYGQTLESRIEWLIIKEARVSNDSIKYLSLGKDFDLKSNLEGLVTVNRQGTEEDYRFKLLFDRNGLPIIEDFLRTVPVTSN